MSTIVNLHETLWESLECDALLGLVKHLLPESKQIISPLPAGSFIYVFLDDGDLREVVVQHFSAFYCKRWRAVVLFDPDSFTIPRAN